MNHPPLNELSYEQAFTELESIISTLEAEEHNLDEALALFERGQSLAHYCTQLLDQAEMSVQRISEGNLVFFNSEA
jgi:exodeoxyribonuclease VII small subunit